MQHPSNMQMIRDPFMMDYINLASDPAWVTRVPQIANIWEVYKNEDNFTQSVLGRIRTDLSKLLKAKESDKVQMLRLTCTHNQGEISFCPECNHKVPGMCRSCLSSLWRG